MRKKIHWGLGVGFYLLGILVTVFTDFFTELWAKIGVVVAGILLSFGLYYHEYHLPLIRTREEYVRRFIYEFVFRSLREEYEDELHDPCEIRVNVMLLKRRDMLPWTQERNLLPWKKSLQISYCTGGYGDEREIKWALSEGVCSTAVMNATGGDERVQEVWSNLEDVHIATWNLTERQHKATDHLGSVLSVPIYRPSDERKQNPVGVLNVDSKKNLSCTKFNASEIRDVVIKYANYVGALV